MAAPQNYRVTAAPQNYTVMAAQQNYTVMAAPQNVMVATQNFSFRGGGYFYKKDGFGGGWNRRYFVLDHSSLIYFKDAESTTAKGSIDLTKGRGVRRREHCKVQWPYEAKPHLCFGIATESRTYYLYTTDMQSIQQWMIEIQARIERVGRASADWKNDVKGKLESDNSKTIRGAVQLASMFAKGMAESGVLDEADATVVKAIANVAQSQAAADRDTNWMERTKMGADAANLFVEGLMGDQSQAERNHFNTPWQGPTPGSSMQPGYAGNTNPPALSAGYTGNINPLAFGAGYTGNTNPPAFGAGYTGNTNPPAFGAGYTGNTNPPAYDAGYIGNTNPLAYGATGGIMNYQAQADLSASWKQIAALGQDLVPFYRYWKSSKSDHFYTTNFEEIGTAIPGSVGRFDYKSEGIQCLVYSTQVMGTVPLYRYWAGDSVINHFYTTNAQEIGTTTKGQRGAYGYVSEGIVAYCFPTAMCGTIPLYRYFNQNIKDHFYTTNSQEIGTVTPGEIGRYGYRSEGIVCYVVPYYG